MDFCKKVQVYSLKFVFVTFIILIPLIVTEAHYIPNKPVTHMFIFVYNVTLKIWNIGIYILSNVYSCLIDYSDNGASDLPGQAWGVFFGWVKVESMERLKIVASIRWDHSRGAFERNIVRI